LGTIAVPGDEPGFVVVPGELDERGSQLSDGIEGLHPQQVLLQGSHHRVCIPFRGGSRAGLAGNPPPCKQFAADVHRLADAIGLMFQQVQKHEKGTNRMGSSRLQQVANVLQVPVTFLFEGVPGKSKAKGKSPSMNYVSEFLASPDGLVLAKAFVQIDDARLRRSIVGVVNASAAPEA
jgi:transcriptional regulator with XRE-family HTH domain